MQDLHPFFHTISLNASAFNDKANDGKICNFASFTQILLVIFHDKTLILLGNLRLRGGGLVGYTTIFSSSDLFLLDAVLIWQVIFKLMTSNYEAHAKRLKVRTKQIEIA